MNKKGTFYYSQKQRDAMSKIKTPMWRKFAILDDGKEVEYTAWVTHSAEPMGEWDDYVCLGKGEFSRMEK